MNSATQKAKNSITSSDDTTVFTPSATISSEKEPFASQRRSPGPQPNKTFLICDINTGQLLTLLDGIVCLHPAGTLGSAYHWTCHEHHGWFGFKNIATGTYLGHNRGGSLIAMAAQQQSWENFCVRLMPNGSFVLLMSHWGKLWPVTINNENGLQNLENAAVSVEDGVMWEFSEVPTSELTKGKVNS